MVRALVSASVIVCLASVASATSPPTTQDPSAVVTSRPCDFGNAPPAPGPACLLARNDIGALSNQPVYWHIETFPDEGSALMAKDAAGTVVSDFGKVWLFTIAGKAWHAKGGTHVATIGPLPVDKADAFTAEYVHSFFTPGTTAPIHKHSGPEGFYAIEGDTCLEMPGGAHTGYGQGNTAVMNGGEPMLLMAIGTTPRKAFALVLHDSTLPATTRVSTWKPAGLCAAKLAGN